MPSEDAFFTAQRLGAWGCALVAFYVAAFCFAFAENVWPVDGAGRATFNDFLQLRAAGEMALSGQGIAAYDQAHFVALQARLPVQDRGAFPWFHWLYPPHFMLALAAFAHQPYVVDMLAWTAATMALYLVVIWRIVPSALTPLLALAPVTAPFTVVTGHTSFLLAALLGEFLRLAPHRPFLAGISLGLLTYKPQFGVLFPLLLLLGRQWRIIAGAAASVLLLGTATAAAFGWDVWLAYWGSLRGTNTGNFMRDAGVDAVIQTGFGIGHALGAPQWLKWTIHAGFLAIVVPLVARVWLGPAPAPLKAAAAALGAAAATPYMQAYDLLILVVPAAFLVRDMQARGFLPGERWTLLACFLGLFLSPPLPVGPVLVAALLVLVLRRVRAMPM